MNNFDYITIIHKPILDYETDLIVNSIEEYAEYRGILLLDFSKDEEHISIDSPVLIISVGGDGTMLGAMREATKYSNAAILGLNTGTLGFLTEEIPEKIITYLDSIIFKKNFYFDNRMLLEASLIIDGEEQDETFIAANEFVLSASVDAPIVSSIYINDQFVTEQLGSGVIASSPTGSTAMSLSAGGVIVNPSSNSIQIIPLLSHTLTTRPIITSGKDQVSFYTTLTDRVPTVKIRADGRKIFTTSHEIGTDIGISITKYSQDVRILRPKNWNFFTILTEKMKW